MMKNPSLISHVRTLLTPRNIGIFKILPGDLLKKQHTLRKNVDKDITPCLNRILLETAIQVLLAQET